MASSVVVKMLQVVVLGALLSATLAQLPATLAQLPATLAQLPGAVKIMSFINDVRTDGFDFAYELSDGTIRKEKGTLKNPGTDNEIWEVVGYSKWISPDGEEHEQEYQANELGYRAGPALNVKSALAGK